MYKIALVGRPNVGKSALFNRLTGERQAIVEDVCGVTRDRLYGVLEFEGVNVEIIDTGGIDHNGKIAFSAEIRQQTMLAIDEADSLVFVVDAQVGALAEDQEVAKLLLQTKKPVVLAVNKAEGKLRSLLEGEFLSLGFANIMSISAIHGDGIYDLLEVIVNKEYVAEVESKEKVPKVAIMGRPNMGKSTLFNAMVKSNRTLVSDIPGTTRDSIEEKIMVDGKPLIFIDTAGLRKRKSERETVDKFSRIRVENSLARCDLVILVIDATMGFTTYEKTIFSMIEKQGKGCILFFNKWDKVHGVRQEHYKRELYVESQFVKVCPNIIGSALEKRGIDQLLNSVFEVYSELNKRVSTGSINAFIEMSMQKVHPPMSKGKRLRVYYTVQVRSCPPIFTMFVNYSELMTSAYKKYLINQIRSEYRFKGCPIVLILKQKKIRKQTSEKRIKSELECQYSHL